MHTAPQYGCVQQWCSWSAAGSLASRGLTAGCESVAFWCSTDGDVGFHRGTATQITLKHEQLHRINGNLSRHRVAVLPGTRPAVKPWIAIAGSPAVAAIAATPRGASNAARRENLPLGAGTGADVLPLVPSLLLQLALWACSELLCGPCVDWNGAQIARPRAVGRCVANRKLRSSAADLWGVLRRSRMLLAACDVLAGAKLLAFIRICMAGNAWIALLPLQPISDNLYVVFLYTISINDSHDILKTVQLVQFNYARNSLCVQYAEPFFTVSFMICLSPCSHSDTKFSYL